MAVCYSVPDSTSFSVDDEIGLISSLADRMRIILHPDMTVVDVEHFLMLKTFCLSTECCGRRAYLKHCKIVSVEDSRVETCTL
jgi:hypothetical protein